MEQTGAGSRFEGSARTEPAISNLADRLDAASAERILRRAIELQASDVDDTYDIGLIERVAAEMGIPSEYVAAAMAEELHLTSHRPTALMERLFVPDSITVTRVAHLRADHVLGRAKEWMSREEGMQVAGTSGDGIVWAKNPSPVVAVRAGLKMQQGTGALRNARRVTTSFHRAGDDATAVTISADGRVGRYGAIAAGTMGGLGLAILNGVLWGAGYVPGYLISIVVGFIISLAIAAAVAKAWAASLRTGMERAATGITAPELLERKQTVPELFTRFRSEMRRRH